MSERRIRIGPCEKLVRIVIDALDGRSAEYVLVRSGTNLEKARLERDDTKRPQRPR